MDSLNFGADIQHLQDIIMADLSKDIKIPLPTFLKALTGNGVPPSKAMAVAGKLSATKSS